MVESVGSEEFEHQFEPGGGAPLPLTWAWALQYLPRAWRAEDRVQGSEAHPPIKQ